MTRISVPCVQISGGSLGRLLFLCAAVCMHGVVSPAAMAQERISVEPMGWSFLPPVGWTVIETKTLTEIERDLRMVSPTTTLYAGYALREQGALPRLLVSVHELRLGTRQAAADFVQSLGAHDSELSGDDLTFSSSTSLPHGMSDVLVLTEGFVGANGVVMLVVYTREEDVAVAREALAAAAVTGEFAAGARLKPAEDSNPTDDVVQPESAAGEAMAPVAESKDAAQQIQPVSKWTRVGQWGLRGAIVGAMIAVILFGLRFLRVIWTTGSENQR
jgi:hypothetical protein